MTETKGLTSCLQSRPTSLLCSWTVLAHVPWYQLAPAPFVCLPPEMRGEAIHLNLAAIKPQAARVLDSVINHHKLLLIFSNWSQAIHKQPVTTNLSLFC